MIEVKNLCKYYGDRNAINNLNFTVKKGEVVGFLGPNGAGKTTTMKIITGFMAPTTGQVKVADFDVFENPIEVKRKIGYLPETPPVYGDMQVEDYLRFVAKLRRTPKDKIKQYVDESLEKTDLQDVRGRLIQNLSKGYRQRVGLAQALVSQPEILILDEPTVGLDPTQVAEVRRLILGLKGHHTIVLSTHILPEVQAVCERIIIINRGHIIAEDSLEGLSRRMSGSQRITLKVRRPNASLQSSLAQVKGVLRVQVEGSQLQMDVDGNEETIEGIAKHVVESQAGLLEMKSSGLGLEDIFIKLTREDSGQNGRKEVMQ